MALVAIKPKTCKQCKAKFIPAKPLQSVCGFICAIDHAKALAEKKNALEALKSRKETIEKKNKLKTRSELLKELQTIFNTFIRLRDGNNACISCNRWHTGQYHAGHYRSVGSAPHLRFNEDNVHRQCSVCNNHLSGNLIHYRAGLIKKIGQQAVERLEANQEPAKYTIEQIQQLKIYYRQKIKELKNAKND